MSDMFNLQPNPMKPTEFITPAGVHRHHRQEAAKFEAHFPAATMPSPHVHHPYRQPQFGQDDDIPFTMRFFRLSKQSGCRSNIQSSSAKQRPEPTSKSQLNSA